MRRLPPDYLGAIILAVGIVLGVSWLKARADAPKPAPAKQKLVGASWHCWERYPCELWYLARQPRTGDIAEYPHIAGEDGSQESFDETIEPPKGKWRAVLAVPKGKKLLGATWRCYGGGSCQVHLVLRDRLANEKADVYFFHNGKESGYLISE